MCGAKIIIPNKYEFVGNGNLIINGFNPDFVCKEKNLIIELFGNYWHKPEEELERPQYFENYHTLIIWEHELNNLKKLKRKILNFHYGNK